jgi:hypothetical protein
MSGFAATKFQIGNGTAGTEIEAPNGPGGHVFSWLDAINERSDPFFSFGSATIATPTRTIEIDAAGHLHEPHVLEDAAQGPRLMKVSKPKK